MAQQYTLEVQRREDMGKNAMHRLRKKGYIPGVYYNNQEGENIPIQVVYGHFERILARAHKSNVIDLTIADGQSKMTRPVLIWNVQHHPVKDLFLHTDFIGVDLKQEMDVDVQVTVTGQAKGEAEGGIVTIYRDALSVTCLPTNIPDQIEIDVSDLEINDSITVKSLRLPEGVVVKDAEEDYAVGGVAPPTDEEIVEGEGAEEGLEGEEGQTGSAGSGEESSE
ncbi:MAG: 50S ribosomal protein L25 [Desulfovermiculus sp.]